MNTLRCPQKSTGVQSIDVSRRFIDVSLEENDPNAHV